jgi:hypothetical protein
MIRRLILSVGGMYLAAAVCVVALAAASLAMAQTGPRIQAIEVDVNSTGEGSGTGVLLGEPMRDIRARTDSDAYIKVMQKAQNVGVWSGNWLSFPADNDDPTGATELAGYPVYAADGWNYFGGMRADSLYVYTTSGTATVVIQGVNGR